MSGFQAFVARFQLPLFLLIAFGVSWIELFQWLSGHAAGPGMNPLGPVVATVVVTLLVGGWRGLVRTVRYMTRVRCVRLSSWAVAVGAPVAMGFGTVGLARLLDVPLPIAPEALTVASLGASFLFMVTVVGPGEEPGWRGFLQTWLNAHMSPLKGTAVMSLIWMLWHTPMFMSDSTVTTLLPHLLGMIGICVVMVWITNNAGGSVLPAVICHACANMVGAVFPPTPQAWWLEAAVYLGMGLAIVVATRGRLGYARAPEPALPWSAV